MDVRIAISRTAAPPTTTVTVSATGFGMRETLTTNRRSSGKVTAPAFTLRYTSSKSRTSDQEFI
jgi:hypothetical protein